MKTNKLQKKTQNKHLGIDYWNVLHTTYLHIIFACEFSSTLISIIAVHWILLGISTLNKYFQNFKVSEGYLYSVDQMLRIKATQLNDLQKTVGLQIDEVYLKSDLNYDQSEDQIIGPHNKANVVLVRGIFEAFKMPIWYVT